MATTTTTQSVAPEIAPFLTYGLGEASRLYATNPQAIGPSQATQTGMTALENRAMQGNPLLGQAQAQLSGTIGGDYLSGNPFFQGAFQPAANAATQAFQDAMAGISSQSSMAGRYGSGAMGDLQNRAMGTLGQSLSDTAGKLAYQNYSDERSRQAAATALAPSFAEADYGDINKLLGLGQMSEQYQLQAQQQPFQNLATYMNTVYGNPLSGMTTSTSNTQGNQPSSTQSTLGNIATAAAIYNQLGGASGVKDAYTGVTDWLSGW